MGLRVRVSQGAERKVYELPARPAERPITVGSGPSATLKSASASVAPSHCVLFVRDGQWVAQSVAADSITLLNNNALHESPLRIGDRLVVGSGADALTIEIDPAAAKAGRNGEPAADAATASPSTSQQPVAPPGVPRQAPTKPPQPPSLSSALTGAAYRPPAPPPTAKGAVPPPRRAVAAPSSQAPQAAPADGDTIDWNVPATATDSSHSAPTYRRPQRTSTMAIVMCVAAAGAVIVIAIAVITMKRSSDARKQAVATAAESRKLAPVDRAVQKNIFSATAPAATAPSDEDGAAMADASIGRRTAGAAGSQPAEEPTTEEAADPASSADPEWLEIQAAADSDDQGAALLKFDDYSRKHPTQNVDKLKEFRADGLDRLWWKRLDQLWEKRLRIQKDIAAKEKSIAEETNAVFKTQLEKEKAGFQAELQRVKATLASEMNSKTESPPDTVNPQSLAKLREARNKAQYAEWCRVTAKYIRTHNGQMPWTGDD